MIERKVDQVLLVLFVKIKKLTRDIGRRKSKEKVVLEPEIEPVIKPKEIRISCGSEIERNYIKTRDYCCESFGKIKPSGPKNITEPSKSVGISKADISQSPSNANAIAIKEIDNKKIDRRY